MPDTTDRPERLFMVFDVESIGLHGEGFAVGYVVVNSDGETLDQGLIACDPLRAKGQPKNLAWVQENVPSMECGAFSPYEVRQEFWLAWEHWKERGAMLVADCCWPVEARFLAACVDDANLTREWEGPYPLHDLASVLLALGRDPLATNERLPSELPTHHPLNDARQSARLLVEALARARAALSAASPTSDGEVERLMELARQYAHAYFNHHAYGSKDGMLVKTKDALRAALNSRPAAAAIPLGYALVPIEPTQEMREAMDDDTPYFYRRNKMREHGQQYEVGIRTNEDWREAISDDQQVIGAHATEEQAYLQYERLVFEWRYRAMIAAAPPTDLHRTLPHPGSPEASAMLDSLLAEYNWPANTKNAARAGWEAANRWLAASPSASQPEPKKDCPYCLGSGVSQVLENGRHVDSRCSCLASASLTPPAPEASEAKAMAESFARYCELLYAVHRKFPGESRHETALRYIREAEASASDSQASANADRT